MTAATYIGDRTIAVTAGTASAPGVGEVRIAVAYTGICGTDLHILHGAMDHRVTIPAVLGHEMSGVVAEVGAEVESWAVGDAVTVMPLDPCGSCPACRAGHEHICHRLVFIGIDAPGSMQTTWTVPAHTLVRLPEGLDRRHAALVEPVAVALHDVRRARLTPGERVLVVGGGPIGLLVAMVARTEGAEVAIAEIDDFRRTVARDLGFRTIDPTAGDVTAVVTEWTEQAGVDVAFEVSGAQAGIDTAIASVASRGRVVIVAIHPQPKHVDLFRLFWREVTIIGARVYERADFEGAIALLADGSVDVEPLISLVVPLARADEAFSALDGGGRVLKVLIDCQEA